MGFQQGLSGLNATSKNLEVIGHNVANANTYGNKASRAEFADMYAGAMNGASGSNIGIGVTLSAVAQQFSQGSITATENSLDLAIKGNGFFQVADSSGSTLYTRNGQFKVDKDGFIINNQNQQLMGYSADVSGNIVSGTSKALQMPTGAGIEPKVSTKVDMELNLDARKPATEPLAVATAAQAAVDAAQLKFDADPSYANSAALATANSAKAAADARATAVPFVDIDFEDPKTYNNATSITAFDGLGREVAVTFYFQKTATIPDPLDPSLPPIDQWNVYTTANGVRVPDDPSGTNPNPKVLQFQSGTARPLAAGTSTFTIPAIDVPATLAIPNIELNVSRATQYGSAFAVSDLSQDGYAPGQLVGIQVNNDGIVAARYSNGKTQTAGQVVISTFRNPQGLQPVGGNGWTTTPNSGEPVPGTPGSGNFGSLQSGALEESNVDLTSELVNMITAQRLYQANAQTIKAEDQILQTIVNLR